MQKLKVILKVITGMILLGLALATANILVGDSGPNLGSFLDAYFSSLQNDPPGISWKF